MRRSLLLGVLLALAACFGPTRSDLAQYERMRQRTAAEGRANADEAISCDQTDMICVRLLVLRGAACAHLSEAPQVADRVRGRLCALEDFRAAERQLPESAPAEDRRRVLTGLAEAQKINRDNSASNEAAADLNRQILATAAQLAPVPGGAPYGAYFEADALTFRGLRDSSSPADACRNLADARARLPGGAAAQDLARRVALLRTTIEGAIQTRRCA